MSRRSAIILIIATLLVVFIVPPTLASSLRLGMWSFVLGAAFGSLGGWAILNIWRMTDWSKPKRERRRRSVPNRMQAQVEEFHRTFKAPVGNGPRLIPKERALLRYNLMQEELMEYEDAIEEQNLVEVADALGDLLYVVFGTAVEHGIDMAPIVTEIHRSNMSKADENGEPIFREDGKILKGENFFPPDLVRILEKQMDNTSDAYRTVS